VIDLADIDTSQTREFTRKRWIMVVAMLGSLLFVAFGVATLTGHVLERDATTVALGWLAVLFGTVNFLLWGYRLVFGGAKLVLVISPSGITDHRISSTEVPWRAVTDVREAGRHSQRYLYLSHGVPLAPKKSALTQLARWQNKFFASDGMFVADHDVDLTLAQLKDLVQAYWMAFGPNPKSTGSAPDNELKGA